MADILKQYQWKLCSLLDSSSDTLESLTVELYSNYIIDESVKNNVLREKGYTGARILLDAAILKVNQNPGAKGAVFKAMETQGILKQLVTEMRTKEQSVILSPQYGGGEIGPFSVGNTSSGSMKMKCEQEVLKDAKSLQDRFLDLLENVRRKSVGIRDVGSLQLRLNFHLARARENTVAVKAVLTKIGRIKAPSEILNCLIRCDLIGYLNYRLLDVFQKLIQEPQLDQLVQDYEDAVQRFLKSTDLKTLAQVFVSNPTVAPITFAGLPQFTVHLNDSWEGKSWHSWDQLLRIRFRWPPRIQIVHLSRNCIIIKYGVLSFFAPDVVRDLTNPQVLSLLEEQGVTKIELSEQLVRIATKEENLDDLLLEAAKHGSDTGIIESLLKRGANVRAISTEWEKCSPLHLAAMNGNCAVVRLLIEYGADIDKEDSSGRTPLHHAAKKGKKEVVELLLKAGADIHKANEYGYTTLHHAVNGNVETVELLLNNGAITDINRKDRLQRSPLHNAAEKGHDKAVALLVKSGAIVDEKDKYGNTPLHLAASHGMKTTFDLLLSYNADYTIQNTDNQTILHSAVEGQNIEIVEAILKLRNASYLHKQVSSPNSCTPLYCAVSHGSVEIVELLLKSGADHSIGDKSGCTPLVVAFEKSHERIVKLLLQAGADPNSVVYYKDERCSLLHYAVRKNDKSMVELLLKYGTDRNKKDSRSRTPLHVAIEMSYDEIAELLLQAGTNLDAVDESGQTPLHIAIAKGHGRVAELLLRAGADRSTADKRGRTPLHVAIEMGRDRIVELLVQAGTNLDAVDERGRTPLHIAIEMGYDGIAELILQAGPNLDVVDENGRTPLHIAVAKGCGWVAELLLQAGANRSIADKKDLTPLHIAVEKCHDRIVELLLQAGANPNSAIGKDGNTPLHCAAEINQEKVMRLLVKYGAIVDKKDAYGNTPLHLAASHGMKTAVELLLSYNADYTIQNMDGQTILHSAVEGRNIQIVEAILKLCGTSCLNRQSFSDGNTPLHLATSHGMKTTVELLLSYNADCTIQNKDGQTILHCAVEGRNIEIVEAILKLCGTSCFNKQTFTDPMYTPLHCAVSHGSVEIVELLLKSGANHSIGDKSGRTSLHIAAKDCNNRIAELLLQAGADFNAVDERGRTSLHIAAEECNDRIAELLLQAGADFKTVDERGRTPLHYAVEDSMYSYRIAELLLQAGADPNAVDKEGFTPFHFLMLKIMDRHYKDFNKPDYLQKHFESTMELFLKYGASINAKSKLGLTPLHHVVGAQEEADSTCSFDVEAEERHSTFSSLKESRRYERYRGRFRTDIVRMLLSKGANVNEQDNDGHTPIYYASDEEVVELLLQYGASKDEHELASSTKSESFYKPHFLPLSHSQAALPSRKRSSKLPHPLPLSHSPWKDYLPLSRPSLVETKVGEYTSEIDPSSILTEQDKDSDSESD